MPWWADAGALAVHQLTREATPGGLHDLDGQAFARLRVEQTAYHLIHLTATSATALPAPTWTATSATSLTGPSFQTPTPPPA